MDITSFVVSQLALFAFREGSRVNEGSYDSQVAIAFIMNNRVKAGWQGGDWLKVIENAHIHAACEQEEMMSSEMPDPWDRDWRRLTVACQGIYDGTLEDTYTRTPGAEALAANLPGTDQYAINVSRPSFFYANLSQPIRTWFIEKILRSPDHPRTINFGTLQLFG